MTGEDVLKMANLINAQRAEVVRSQPSPEMLARAKRLSLNLGALCQTFDGTDFLPNVRRVLAESEELASSLRSDLERMVRP